jgi:hypothetical protein
MKKWLLLVVSLFAVLATLPAAAATSTSHATKTAPPPAHTKHLAGEPTVFDPDHMKWVDAPASLPRGIRMCTMEGDPSKEGPYTVRLWIPATYRIGPYWRTDSERMTVMLGAVIVGAGDHYDEHGGTPVRAGSYAYVAPHAHHYLWTRDATVVQLHGTGPWDITYVHAADDPRHAPPPPPKKK